MTEFRTGIHYEENFSAWGRNNTERLDPTLADRIHAIVKPQRQADPKFQTPLAFTRITAKAVREPPLAEAMPAAATPPSVPAERTVYDILYRLRRVRKTKAQKNIPEADAIFDHLKQVHEDAAQQPELLRISMDTKAKLKIGGFSRGGVRRGQQAVAVLDHDMHPDAVLAPAGILDVDHR